MKLVCTGLLAGTLLLSVPANAISDDASANATGTASWFRAVDSVVAAVLSVVVALG